MHSIAMTRAHCICICMQLQLSVYVHNICCTDMYIDVAISNTMDRESGEDSITNYSDADATSGCSCSGSGAGVVDERCSCRVGAIIMIDIMIDISDIYRSTYISHYNYINCPSLSMQYVICICMTCNCTINCIDHITYIYCPF